jgi:hypothetical protein
VAEKAEIMQVDLLAVLLVVLLETLMVLLLEQQETRVVTHQQKVNLADQALELLEIATLVVVAVQLLTAQMAFLVLLVTAVQVHLILILDLQ